MEGNWQYRISQKRSAQIRSFENTCLVSLGNASCTQECHADSIMAEYKLYPEAYDREDANGAVPSSAVLSRLAQLRLEPDSSEGSSPDEGAPKKGSGPRSWYFTDVAYTLSGLPGLLRSLWWSGVIAMAVLDVGYDVERCVKVPVAFSLSVGSGLEFAESFFSKKLCLVVFVWKLFLRRRNLRQVRLW